MTMCRRTTRRGVLAAAQPAFPERPVRFLVPFGTFAQAERLRWREVISRGRITLD